MTMTKTCFRAEALALQHFDNCVGASRAVLQYLTDLDIQTIRATLISVDALTTYAELEEAYADSYAELSRVCRRRGVRTFDVNAAFLAEKRRTALAIKAGAA